ncbi:MAG TPA: alpha/beta hydrolase family protein [Bryobacteraceae bacterium]|jgi:hypothetical protein|nr:alpha/beta hydrolase family protein [Bryobacteraceae bacterium]
MLRWENDLCFRSNDRVVRPFELGGEWAENWLSGFDAIKKTEDLIAMNAEIIRRSNEFFGYHPPTDFELSGEWLSFTSPVTTPYPENNLVRALWFPAKRSSKAVVLLPHWNSKLPQHNALCRGLQRLGISVLRISLPYHDARTPAGLTRADYAVSANICRTIDATRQAVIDTRACFDWLQQRGFTDLGIVGTSLGSCYAFLASAHDERIRVNVFNHCSTYVADVVWEGLSTRHIRQTLENEVTLPELRQMWECVSPPSYWDNFSAKKHQSKFIYAHYDTTFPVHLSKEVIQSARRQKWQHDVAVLPCGHYTLGAFPFKYLAGYEICSYLKRHL